MRGKKIVGAIGWQLLGVLTIVGGVIWGLSLETQPEPVMGYEKKEGNWTGSWAASPQYPSGIAEDGVSNQTLRLILHPHLSGDKVRIRLSNAFGTQPVTFGEVYLARAGEAASVIHGSGRRVTFQGKTKVTIPVGGELWSDAVSFKVKRGENLAVSLYIPGDSGPATWHRMAKQTSYISMKGNYAASGDGNPYVTRISGWYWLTGIDVKSHPKVGAIVCLGDSITDGAGSTANTNRRYPDYLSRRLQEEGITLSVLNAGISGNKILRDDPVYGPRALERLDRDVFSQSGVTHLILLEGINDIGHDPPTYDAGQIIAGIQEIADRAKEKGLKVYVGTLTPYEGADYATDQGQITRQQVNEWIRNNSHRFDGVIDFDRALRDPERPTRLHPVYDSGDHLHPGDAGYQKMAETIDLSWFR
ncbi:SGNH/GDSL hydrolase family protein [Kroppenstedtia pulmonis]|uniref:SGNH/GDSL hydrolase family protein n=1 Tax=Kroppenstedtia pulmonis TaxID=1380685 RepID=A0A7D4C4T6_9BACL|nr:SGNH/GDSL hydrolase family protein [Kroppenstedtia pulmonis]QKG83396.1 SGNH/GDSL hydrolase family protein [Kroppenstedtia pulmonis]